MWRLADGVLDVVGSGFDRPADLAEVFGEVVVVDTGAHCLRWLDGAEALAGACGTAGGTPAAAGPLDARLYTPYGAGTGRDGVLWVADTYNSVVARLEVPLRD